MTWWRGLRGIICRTREAHRRAGTRLLGLDLAVARRCRRDQGVDELSRRVSDRVHGSVEDLLVGFGRSVGRENYAGDRRPSVFGCRIAGRWRVWAQDQTDILGNFAIRKVKQLI